MKKDIHVVAYYPILPGKTKEWKEFAAELMGPKGKEYKAMLKRFGIEHEYGSLQHTSKGDVLVIADEGKEVSKWPEKAAKSKKPFDRWFMKKVEEMHGPAGSAEPPSELYIDTCEIK
jgi:hypothetical protein